VGENSISPWFIRKAEQRVRNFRARIGIYISLIKLLIIYRLYSYGAKVAGAEGCVGIYREKKYMYVKKLLL
jgi:hypothetical protein